MPYYGGRISVSQAVFTPAGTARAATDVVGGAKEFKGIAQSSGAAVQIVSATLVVASATLVTATWRLFLFNETPPSATADDALYTLPAGDRDAFIGYIDLAQLVDQGDTLVIQNDTLQRGIKLKSRSAWGYLTILVGTPTLAAVAHTVTLHGGLVMAKLLGTEVNANRIDQYWVHPGDDGRDRITVTTAEDVEPVIEQNKKLYNEAPKQIDGVGRKVARIPGVVIMELCRINKIGFREFMLGKTDRAKHVLQSFLNDPACRDFRVTPGLVKVRSKT